MTRQLSLFARIRAECGRDMLENYLMIGMGPSAVLVHRFASDDLVKNLKAAILASNMGTGLDYALDRMVRDEGPQVPLVHDAFQALYFSGKGHLERTLARMTPKDEPSAAEVYADAALTRAVNTYYVAGLLYREGHLIEANAMSRLMLEQIAWAFAAQVMDDVDRIKDLKPTKAIGLLKKK